MKTTVGQHIPKDMVQRVTEFIKTCNTKRERQGIPNGLIGTMDKTAIWADMPANSQGKYISSNINNWS